MRISKLLALVLLAVFCGCATTQPTASIPAQAGTWQVIALNSQKEDFPDRVALLLNTKTGETWVYTKKSLWQGLGLPSGK